MTGVFSTVYLMIHEVKSFGKIEINKICLNVFVEALTNRMKDLDKLSGARATSEKTVLWSCDELGNVIVESSGDTEIILSQSERQGMFSLLNTIKLNLNFTDFH